MTPTIKIKPTTEVEAILARAKASEEKAARLEQRKMAKLSPEARALIKSSRYARTTKWGREALQRGVHNP